MGNPSTPITNGQGSGGGPPTALDRQLLAMDVAGDLGGTVILDGATRIPASFANLWQARISWPGGFNTMEITFRAFRTGAGGTPQLRARFSGIFSTVRTVTDLTAAEQVVVVIDTSSLFAITGLLDLELQGQGTGTESINLSGYYAWGRT